MLALTRNVVQDYDQVVSAFVAKPLMLAPVNVQQHAWQRSPLAPPLVFATLAAARHQARSLQRFLHPGEAQLDAVLFAQLLVKASDVQVEVSLCLYSLEKSFWSSSLSLP